MIYHRIVKADPPGLVDFTSGRALGRPLATEDPEARRLHTGVSVFATARQAANQARQWPSLGSFIAVLDIPPDGPILAERTTGRRGHYTLWGSPADLVNCVVAVMRFADVR